MRGLVLLLLFTAYVVFSRNRPSEDSNEINAPSFKVDYENGRFLLDGKPFQYISGSIHYFRIHPELWLDRLKRVRALGFNAIQFYIPWNYHEEERGIYNFTGSRDFVRFIKLAADLGLYTLLRVGPYSCGEWEFGGFPYWLIAQHEDIRLRTNDPRYTSEVSRWFHALAPLIRPLLRQNGGPILMVQAENEYGGYEICDINYTTFVRNELWSLLGKETVLYTTDNLGEGNFKCGTIPEVLPTIDFGPRARNETEANFNRLRKILPGGQGPLVNSEFYPGWFVEWGQLKQEVPTAAELVETMSDMYGLGASFSMYMAHGGTNFGFWNGAEPEAPVITSYDYTAPIAENGDYRPSYWAMRKWIKGLEGWQNQPTSPPKRMRRTAYDPVELTRVGPITKMKRKSCTVSNHPLSFEKIGQSFGYVLYYTNINKRGKNLTISNIRDFGYVRLGGKKQDGIFIKRFYNKSVHEVHLHDCKIGDKLEILVENQGRQNVGRINDFKGILSSVLLDGISLVGWTQCAMDETLFSEEELVIEDDNDTSGIFAGSFYINEVADTWLDMKNWGKGHVVVNGYNVGRYWSSVGPQFGLYVPSPLLVKGLNNVAVVELRGTSSFSSTSNAEKEETFVLRFSNHSEIILNGHLPKWP